MQFRGDNSPTTVTFSLTSGAGCRAHGEDRYFAVRTSADVPRSTVNGHALTNPGASTQPDSRSVTIGTYRGNNTTFTYSIPAADFVTGANSLTITPISGSSDLSAWLSAGWSLRLCRVDN